MKMIYHFNNIVIFMGNLWLLWVKIYSLTREYLLNIIVKKCWFSKIKAIKTIKAINPPPSLIKFRGKFKTAASITIQTFSKKIERNAKFYEL